MAIDEQTVAKVASLARIKLRPEEVSALAGELTGILAWIEQLNEVATGEVRPFFEDEQGHYLTRPDVVTDGERREAILKNAPEAAHGFFAVPKVVE